MNCATTPENFFRNLMQQSGSVSSAKREFCMYRLWISGVWWLLITLIWAQDVAHKSPAQTWRLANLALEQNHLHEAVILYKQALAYSERNDIVKGKVEALEALALAYKRQGKYSRAKECCLRAIETNAPTYRSYLILAQVAHEGEGNIPLARQFCQKGLQRFPGNAPLLQYLKMLEVQREIAEKRDSRNETADYLSSIEQQVVAEMNLARTQPRRYAQFLRELRPYYEGALLKLPGKVPVLTHEGVNAVNEAIAFLERVAPAPPLRPSPGMSRAARDHVADQGKTGETGHIGSDGSEPFQRLERYGKWQGMAGENIAYGDDSARMIIMQLIIDDGVPDRGHRENMFNPNFRVTGVAFGSHPVYRTMCVITYAGDYQEKEPR
ncbi:MAG: hypothetical protein D6681_08560 [Calditrichaeota bacterium]|nr:MAG: hypothetical protein D6681_08560 [Calditrichota bacterium]